jgi:cytochrome c5
MAKELDQVFVQNFIIILVMLFGMVSIFVILARTLGSDDVKIAKRRAMIIAELTQPVGQVRRAAATGDTKGNSTTASTSEPQAVDENPGKNVFDGLCFSCHKSGLPNIPQLGKAEDWVNRITKGKELIYEHAIKGFTGDTGMAMPAKGGNATLTDEEIRAAVDYMLSSVESAPVAAP